MGILEKILKRIWHDLFYVLFPGRRLSSWMALNCREAVLQMNTQDAQTFRLKLHLSLCSACKNYFEYSVWLRENLRPSVPQMKDLNEKLLKKIIKP